MTRRLKTALSLLGIGVASLAPSMAAYAVTAPATNSQYMPQAAAASAPASDVASKIDATPATDGAASDLQKTTKRKGHYKDQVAAVAETSIWDQPYIGVYVGAVAANSKLNTNMGVATPTSYLVLPAHIALVGSSATGTIHSTSAVAGIKLGTSSKVGHFVYGGELEFGSFSISGSESATNVTFPTTANQFNVKSYMSTSWMAAARLRVGVVPKDNWPLFFLAAGPALTEIHVYNSYSDNFTVSGVGGGTNTKAKFGVVAGGGVEIPIYKNMTIDAEYQYLHFGTNNANSFVGCSVSCGGFRSPLSTSANLNANQFTAGLNYKIA